MCLVNSLLTPKHCSFESWGKDVKPIAWGFFVVLFYCFLPPPEAFLTTPSRVFPWSALLYIMQYWLKSEEGNEVTQKTKILHTNQGQVRSEILVLESLRS